MVGSDRVGGVARVRWQAGRAWLAEHHVIGNEGRDQGAAPGARGAARRRGAVRQRGARTGLIEEPAYVARYLDLGRLPSGQPYAILEYLEGETLFARLARLGPAPGERGAVDRAPARERGRPGSYGGDRPSRHRARERVPRDWRAPARREGARLRDREDLRASAGASGPKTQLRLLPWGPSRTARRSRFLGEAVGPPADVYALGATIFHLLVGHAPFTGDPTEIAVAKTLTQRRAALARRAKRCAASRRGARRFDARVAILRSSDDGGGPRPAHRYAAGWTRDRRAALEPDGRDPPPHEERRDHPRRCCDDHARAVRAVAGFRLAARSGS